MNICKKFLSKTNLNLKTNTNRYKIQRLVSEPKTSNTTVAGSPIPASLTALHVKLAAVSNVTGSIVHDEVTTSGIGLAPRYHWYLNNRNLNLFKDSIYISIIVYGLILNLVAAGRPNSSTLQVNTTECALITLAGEYVSVAGPGSSKIYSRLVI